jgi:uncharacterized protein YuzE
MTIQYDIKTDLLYLMIEPSNHKEIINKRVSDEIVLDIGESDKIIGIEIMNASKHLNLQNIMPVEYEKIL